MSVIAISDRIRRSHRAGSASRAAATWGTGLVALALLFVCSATAFAAPVLDGNIDDVVAQANAFIQNGTGCGIVINDPSKDVCLTDILIVPCTTSFDTCTLGAPYYVNGFDQILAVATVQGSDAWWGIRTAGGQIGDADGDGTDDKGGSCPPPGGGNPVQDAPGIGPGESYVIQLDTDCDNITDVRITVTGGSGTHQPTVIITDGGGNPIAGSGTAQYGTTDLEIHTTGIVLPAVFKMSTFVGSQSDGLSEDAAGPVACNAPLVSLLVEKTASKPDICPGDTDRFTVSVHNTSLVDLVTNVRDILPAGWTYADNVSGDFAFNSQNGQVVSFGPLTIPAGATRTVSFDATSPSDCLGPYENKAVADGSFSSPCLPPPGVESALSDTARATVNCGVPPCVTIECAPVDTSVTLNDPYTVRATATNCSNAPEDITITLNGQETKFTGVAAGASVTAYLAQTCVEPGVHTYDASATATNDCGTTNPAATCQAKVTCTGNPLCCWLTQGGFLNASFRSGNKDNTFGGNVGPPPSGSWEHIQRNGKEEVFNFHSHDAHVIACSNDGTEGPCHPKGDANVIDFGGTGAYSLNGGSREFAATFTAHSEDHGEPGRVGDQKGGCGTPDFYSIEVKDAETGEVVFTAAGLLDGGNLQIHDCKHANKTSAPTRAGGPGTLSTDGTNDLTVDGSSAISTLELYRPTPNPFSNTTNFAYQVTGSASERVQIGIYNVAGRLIRELVNETKAPGRYQTVWNGQDMGGSTVNHGVYFIRAYVGGVRVDAASRILYLR